MENLLISVIMPIYNVDGYIKKCFDSLLNQTYKNFEVICINDCSQDNSVEIASEYAKLDSRIKVINNDKNIGAGRSRNKGFEYASGDYIYFLDPDDWIEKDAFEIYIKNINLHNKPDLIMSRYRMIDANNGRSSYSKKFDKSYTDKTFNVFKNPEILEYWASGMFCIYNRDFLLENNIKYNDFSCIEDIAYSIDVILKAQSILFIDVITLNYRIKRRGSISSNIPNSVDKILTIVEYTKNISSTLSSDIKTALEKYIYRYMFDILIKAYRCKNIDYNELKNSIAKYVDYNIISINSLPDTQYYMHLYNKIIGWRKVYFDTYFELKHLFPVIFRSYSIIKKSFINRRFI